ncbi:hypothetical protein HPB50_006789 [Hyalomma asiaticum]|uniref:Uncharacterized protein n=1 Tax=Hyalomma asiaticum TaxID=266040 RepID=A0ACB7RJH0_HYAAI|nr:hypothetical protein HPB50_006789 [Hyalomma asiaticum]
MTGPPAAVVLPASGTTGPRTPKLSLGPRHLLVVCRHPCSKRDPVKVMYGVLPTGSRYAERRAIFTVRGTIAEWDSPPEFSATRISLNRTNALPIAKSASLFDFPEWALTKPMTGKLKPTTFGGKAAKPCKRNAIATCPKKQPIISALRIVDEGVTVPPRCSVTVFPRCST